jgi:hypothetical protein
MMNLTKNRILVVRVKEANPLLRFPCSALKRLIIINISSSSRCELNARRRIKSAQKQTERRRKRVVVFKPTSLSFSLYSRFNHSLFVRTTVRVRETKTTENNSLLFDESFPKEGDLSTRVEKHFSSTERDRERTTERARLFFVRSFVAIYVFCFEESSARRSISIFVRDDRSSAAAE